MATYLNIARPYANALFAYAKDQGVLDEWLIVMQACSALLKAPDIQRLLHHPQVTAQSLVDIFEQAIFAPKKISASVQRFLELLAYRRRLIACTDILVLYEALYRQAKRQSIVHVRSAFKMSEVLEIRLKAVMEKQLGCQISLAIEVDPALIGGVVISAQDYVIDGSIQGKLKRLSQALVSQ